MTKSWAAIILAGGSGVRLGRVDKAGIVLDGRSLLDWSIDAVVDAGEVVVLGDAAPTVRPVSFVRESPPHGGPAAGLLAGFDALPTPSPFVGVLAVDMPRVTALTFRRLFAAVGRADGAVLTGPDGRRQLCCVLTSSRLAQVRPPAAEQHGLALHALLEPLDLVEVPAQGLEHRDVDDWADLDSLG